MSTAKCDWHQHEPRGSFPEFFEELDRLAISPGRVLPKLVKMERDALIGLAYSLREKLPPPSINSKRDPFSFVANGHLSGTVPNLPIGVRLAGVDALARFAALYATSVLVREPFEVQWLASLARGNSRVPLPVEIIADDLAGQLETLLFLRPLFEAQLADIMYNFFPELPAIERVNAELQRILSAAEAALFRSYGERVSFSVSHIQRNGLTMSLASGARDLVVFQDAIGHFSFRKLPAVKGQNRKAKSSKQGDLITLKVAKGHPWFKEMFGELLGPILSDIGLQAVSSMAFRTSYLTNREADVKALEGSNTAEGTAISRRLFKDLAHEIPVIQDIPLANVIALREREQEAFQVYRDAVRAALHEGNSAPLKGRELYQDIIRPELNKIDLAMRRNREMLFKAAARDAVLGIGAVALGIYSGLVTPELGDAIAKLGGLKFGIDLLKNVKAATEEPQSIRENRFYFLWKLQQLA
jgi:hypothetical protein